jgi:integrase
MAKKLTPISVEKAKPNLAKRIEIPDGGQPGLYLVVQPSGAKSWAVRYRLSGKPRKLTLHGGIPLADARSMAREALVQVAKGIDPAAEKRAKRRSPSNDDHIFAVAYEEFLQRHVKVKTSLGYSRNLQRFFRLDVVPAWGNRDIRTITRLDVNRLLDGVVDRIKAKDADAIGASANTVRTIVGSFFKWAVRRGYLDTSPVVGVKAPLALVSRDRVLADDEIRRLWIACDAIGYPCGTFAQMLLLTGQRRTEVAAMTWQEVNLKQRAWTLPRDRSKNDEAHVVPLSDAVMDILQSLPRIGGRFVFTVTGEHHLKDYAGAKKQIDAQTMLADHWTFHDLRRTVATGMARLHITQEVAEKVLNHISGKVSGISAIYNRYDYAEEQRQALDVWARYVLNLTHPAATNVVAIR